MAGTGKQQLAGSGRRERDRETDLRGEEQGARKQPGRSFAKMEMETIVQYLGDPRGDRRATA